MIWDRVGAGAVEISSAELSHTGRYSCTARNAAGSTHRHVQLTVQGNATAQFEYSVHFYLDMNTFCTFKSRSSLTCSVVRLFFSQSSQ